MGLRFRKNINLFRGVRLNLSKSGGSFSFGSKGFTVNLGKNGTRSTLGLPGSGLSYSSYERHNGKIGWIWTIVLIVGALVIYLLREQV